jgi:hypothetical protein
MFQAKKAPVLGRQLKVQKLVIPFKITGHATPASKVITVDQPDVLFIQTEGLTQIANGLDSDEASPTFAVTADDSDGKINLMVKVGESISKVQYAQVISRTTGVAQPAFKDATSATSANGDKILLHCDSTVDLSAADLDACLIVEYIVAE